MAGRFELIEAFRDTQRRIMADPVLEEETRRMMAGTLLFLPGYDSWRPPVWEETAAVEVCEDTTFHCAQREIRAGDGYRTAVLNFANAYSPGGGVAHGAMAQEECLCRSSNLYAALKMRYLWRNYYKWNEKHTGDMGTDAVIWSPGVTVFKSDDAIPVLLEESFQVDVLTCAAPYYDTRKKHPVTPERLREVFDSRIRNILEVAASREVEVLILGAFGCGAFNNPPELVASSFREQLMDRGYGKFFRKVVFAIKRNDYNNTNLQAFQEVFRDDY